MKTDIRLRDIALSLLLLTRLPVPKVPDSDLDRQAQSAWAFPVVGLIIGGFATLTILILQHLGQPDVVCAGLALTLCIFFTGAMHEDGLADTVDGFWGGYTKERRLEIMKDSHIGTYGVLALILSLGLRWMTLATLIATIGAWVMIPIAALSRAAMPVLMISLPNARDHGLSHHVGTPSRRPAALGLGIAMSVAWTTLGVGAALVCVVVGALGLFGLYHLIKCKIGGRTGDTLGAAQQLAEILCLLTLVSLT
ncbi:adenosylcobinamide-GDP ribazoletransferase [Epibacterium ulvae]|uniref:adenosylcobinamide-GDP ribazoletransferase n=1 Tax=Epibacterium ulvae TaxID=1156985 RepID=UPI001BFCC324|nr:adenosylcobinamide-GDP ribazoletransferase [Epibacterium ulvae]MBT8154213.1 adenosylcobinamide-GDP ribazoletransferase [Epibacterium ulvae]